MRKTVLDEPNMKALKINGEKYENLYLQSGTCEDAEFINCVFFGVEFEGVWINNALFKICQFDDTLFYDVQAYDARFHDSTFSKVEFKGCNLAKADFSNCIFEEVIFGADNIGSATDISGACFDGVDLRNITFINVEYDVKTRFPKGFDPKREKGLRLV